MRQVPVRFPDHLWDEVSQHATSQGISAAEWLREAAIVRLAYWSMIENQELRATVEHVERLVRARP